MFVYSVARYAYIIYDNVVLLAKKNQNKKTKQGLHSNLNFKTTGGCVIPHNICFSPAFSSHDSQVKPLYESLCIHANAPHVPGACADQKEASHPLILELLAVISYHVGAWDQICVL